MGRPWLAVLVVGGLLSTAGCTAPAGARTFQTRAMPMVGGYCSYVVESEPSRPCLDGMEKVFSANPGLTDGASSSTMIEVTATLTVSSATRSNSANPPQSTTVTVWTIDQLVSAKVAG